MTSAAELSSEIRTGSNLMTYRSPRPSRIWKPGVKPPILLLNTRHGTLMSGPSIVSGPRASASVDIRRTPCRFVNQALSDTSSSVFGFCASPKAGSPRSVTMCPKRSNMSLSAISAGSSGTSSWSLSTSNGSSG